MSSESHDEMSDRGAAASQQEQNKIIEEDNRPIKGSRLKDKILKVGGEAEWQEQERVIEDSEK